MIRARTFSFAAFVAALALLAGCAATAPPSLVASDGGEGRDGGAAHDDEALQTDVIADAEEDEDDFDVVEARLASSPAPSPGGSSAGGVLSGARAMRLSTSENGLDCCGIIEHSLTRARTIRVPESLRLPGPRYVQEYVLELTSDVEGQRQGYRCVYRPGKSLVGVPERRSGGKRVFYRTECTLSRPAGARGIGLLGIGGRAYVRDVKDVTLFPRFVPEEAGTRTSSPSYALSLASYTKSWDDLGCSINSALLGLVVGAGGVALTCSIVPPGQIVCAAPAAVITGIAAVGTYFLSQSVMCEGISFPAETPVTVVLETERCQALAEFVPDHAPDLIQMCRSGTGDAVRCTNRAGTAGTTRHFPCYGDHWNGTWTYVGYSPATGTCFDGEDQDAVVCFDTTVPTLSSCDGVVTKSCGRCATESSCTATSGVYCGSSRCPLSGGPR